MTDARRRAILRQLDFIQADIESRGWPRWTEDADRNMECATEYARRREQLMQDNNTTWEEFQRTL